MQGVARKVWCPDDSDEPSDDNVGEQICSISEAAVRHAEKLYSRSDCPQYQWLFVRSLSGVLWKVCVEAVPTVDFFPSEPMLVDSSVALMEKEKVHV
jgi:hypothetical protein